MRMSSHAGRATLTMPMNRKGHATTELAAIDRRPAAGADKVSSIEVETGGSTIFRFPIADRRNRGYLSRTSAASR